MYRDEQEPGASPEEIQGTIDHVNRALEKVHCRRRFGGLGKENTEQDMDKMGNVIHKTGMKCRKRTLPGLRPVDMRCQLTGNRKLEDG